MKTALVIDNSKLMRTVVKGMLEEQGIKAVGEAADIQEGIAAYETLKPDLVTLDLVMPGGSGVEVLKSIISKNPSAKVVIITETGQDSAEKQLVDLGARAVLRKPITSEAVKEALARLQDDSRSAASPAPSENMRSAPRAPDGKYHGQGSPSSPAAPGADIGAGYPPSAAAKDVRPLPAAGSAPIPVTPAKKKTRVLVVDDSLVMRAMIKAILEEEGLEIVGEAGDVPEAIKTFEALKPDLMTLDLIMPGGSGMDVLKSVIPQNPDARVIVITAVNQAQVEEEAFQLGARAVVNKPLTEDVVKAALDKALASADVPAPAAAAGAQLTEEQAKALHELFQNGADKCVQAMNTMCKADWKLLDFKLGAGAGKECAAMLSDLKIGESISIQMTVAKDIPMVALLVASQQGAEKIARLLTRNKPDRVDREVVKLVWMEWSNILITTVLNVFANSMGSAILSSTPEFLEGPTDEIVMRSCAELSDNPEEPLFIAHTSFVCESLNADCRTVFLLRMDSMARLTSSADRDVLLEDT